MNSTYEVEVKLAIEDIAEIEERIRLLGAERTNIEVQIDSYFNHPCKSFQATDEALRVRERRPLDHEGSTLSTELVELTYKGPKIDTTTKTRAESSVQLNDAESVTTILESLGFKLVAQVSKKRQFFSLSEMTISTDEVEDVGLFIELESIANNEDELAEKRERIFKVVKDLGLDITQSIRESYLELYLNR